MLIHCCSVSGPSCISRIGPSLSARYGVGVLTFHASTVPSPASVVVTLPLLETVCVGPSVESGGTGSVDAEVVVAAETGAGAGEGASEVAEVLRRSNETDRAAAAGVGSEDETGASEATGAGGAATAWGTGTGAEGAFVDVPWSSIAWLIAIRTTNVNINSVNPPRRATIERNE